MLDLTRMVMVAAEACTLASELIRTRSPGVLTPKGDRDYASEVDFAVEREVRSFLADATPTVGFLGEEEGADQADATALWALDPIDGTVNFAHGLPLCAVSLGLIVARRPVLGVIDLPFLGSRYTAVDGGGARRDGASMKVSGTTHLSAAVVSIGDYAVGPEAARRNIPRLAATALLARSALRVRMLGSAAIDLAWLADGKSDAVIAFSNKPWDTAAGVVIAREAGAVVVDLDGSDHGVDSIATIAAPPSLISEILTVARRASTTGQASTVEDRWSRSDDPKE